MGDELRAKLPKYQEQLARHRFLAQQKATGSGRSNHEGDRRKEEIRGKKRDDQGDGSGRHGWLGFVPLVSLNSRVCQYYVVISISGTRSSSTGELIHTIATRMNHTQVEG